MPSLLSEIVRATAVGGTADAVLERVAQVLAGRHPGLVLADRLDPPDLITRVAAFHGGAPMDLPDRMGSLTMRRSAAHAGGLLPAVLDSPGGRLHLHRAQLEEAARSAEPHQARQGAMLLSFGVHEVVGLALLAREGCLGVLTIGSYGPLRPEEISDLADVALHLGTALDAARLLALQHEVAGAMQLSLLPALPLVPGLALAARYIPATEGVAVGGDWYDAFWTAEGLVLVVGDASGHDVSAAARMAELRSTLRAHAIDRREPPSQWVARLDRSTHALGVESTATCLVALLAPAGDAGWTLRWSSAGHLPPVHRHAARSRAELLETAPDLMLGVHPATPRTDHVRTLGPGDLLLLYSDGLVEVRGVPLDDGLEVLRDTVERAGPVGPDQLAEHLLSTLASSPTDDVALLAVRVLPA
ncbi:MAG TPA: PP2C family protein-serine/threonine phosphatase [Actinomycetales bacterium]